MNKKLQAYTVIEMVVVMLLSAITIGVAYESYRIFSKQFLDYQSRTEILYDQVMMDRLLRKDISECELLIRQEEGIACIAQNKEQPIEYRFTEKYLLRKHLQTDSFYIAPKDFKVWFLNKEQQISGAIIDRISFTVQKEDETIENVYEKHYGADVQMKYEKDNFYQSWQ